MWFEFCYRSCGLNSVTSHRRTIDLSVTKQSQHDYNTSTLLTRFDKLAYSVGQDYESLSPLVLQHWNERPVGQYLEVCSHGGAHGES
jgi:hypothetical protein